MKRLAHTPLFLFFAFCFLLSGFTSCVKEEFEPDDSPRGNFEALWRIMDEHYCFFDYKEKEIGVNWNEVHTRYAAKISPDMGNKQLFEVLCQMIGELRDGHVNIGAAFDYGRNWSYFEDYPDNFRADIVENYLGRGNDYQIAAGLKYRILDDNVGYVRYESFQNTAGDGNISYMLDALRVCSGLIVDVRNNGGGDMEEARRFASHFTNQQTLVGYVRHKTGTGHGDFSDEQPLYIDPASSVRWQKPVVVLTNRRCFSATNDFVKCMSQLPLVTVLGDQTGGGSGMPFTLELPNGWSVRYSAIVFLDTNHQHTEFGIKPDVPLQMDDADLAAGRDTYIEAARQLLQP